MNEEPNEEMNDLNVYGFLEVAEEILGEVAHFFEKEGKDGLPLARRVRQEHERLGRWQERVPTKEPRASRPGADELEEIHRAQRCALERIASGVRPAGADRGPTMLTIREARSIAQSVLHLSEEKSEDKVEDGRSPVRDAGREAERLRASALSGDLDGAKRQARMILERGGMLNAKDPEVALLHTFAQTLLGCLEGKMGVEIRHAVTTSLVRREQEARESAERRAGQTERESAGLRRTLAWYAREANYGAAPDTRRLDTCQHGSSPTAADQDRGRRARQTLDDSESGREVARRLEAAEKFIEHLKADFENYKQEVAQHDPPG